MSVLFMSEGWIKLVANQWNTNNQIIQQDLRNFTASWEYYIEDRPNLPHLMMVCEKGKIVFAGKKDERICDFEMWTLLENWKKILNKEISPKMALMSRKLKFKGSMMTALKYMKAFEIHLNILGEIEADFDI
ncbi:SCP-2 sterol transfer family protein [Desulfurella acetivorans A63]|nr:SCP-2 sterol transfer family protein [Desulfurella acetivorans A63]